ncbi:hypothetical protein A2U01_0073764, partial [Trifolium medium]|nr:hypothetical protein [Trifolium medium]
SMARSAELWNIDGEASVSGALRRRCWRVAPGCEESCQGRPVSGAWCRLMWRVAQIRHARRAGSYDA